MLELTSDLLAEIGGWPALKEARGLVERGRVSEARREGSIIRARVRGAEKTHEPQIVLADRVADIEVRCTCLESRRTGRVCPHILAAGLGFLKTSRIAPSAEPSLPIAPRGSEKDSSRSLKKIPRWLSENAPANIVSAEITVLLPLQLREALAKDPVRVILEASLNGEAQTQPFDVVQAAHTRGIVVSEEDDRLLNALESLTGTAQGINALPRGKFGAFLHAVGDHPRLWLGKKQRIEVRPTDEQPEIVLQRGDDGSLQMRTRIYREVKRSDAGLSVTLPIPGWEFDGKHLIETPAVPPGFALGIRQIPLDQIPDFLTRELPVLERTCHLVFAPGFEEFRLEIGQPQFEARLEGVLSGLTLELFARYGNESFPLHGKTEPGAYQRYQSDPRHPSLFWRRNILAERAALAEVESSGFGRVRAGAATFSLISENHVARFLANTLPRWKKSWTLIYGPRLEATMEQIDFARPEFSLHRPGAASGSGEDWLSLDLKLSVGGKPIALDQSEIQRWMQTGQSHARTSNKRVLLIPTEAWSEMKEVLSDCEVEQEPGKIRVAPRSVPYLSGALMAQGFSTNGSDAIDLPATEVKKALDEKLISLLRPYQLHGVEWLAGLAQRNFHGLLADDMGLGKTLQALAFAAWLHTVAVATDCRHAEKAKAGDVPRRARSLMLVVCPTSLVANWKREAGRFVPHLRTLDLTSADRAEKWAQRGAHDLLVTSYAILRRDIELYRAEEFSLVILDEAQHIKNRASQNAQSAKALRARHRLILTGTPLENSVLDLWSLYDFLSPGYLGTAAEFKERYETPLLRGPEPKLMERLRHRVQPFFLRRTKVEVLTELPPKMDFPTLCELSDEQREVYRAVLAQGRREVFEQSDKAGRNAGRDRLAVLTTLLRLRQVCCHLDLLPHDGDKRTWKEPSSKMERTFELIDEAIDGGHRVLLFSQFVKVLYLLREEAVRREIKFCYLDGQTAERQSEVDRFQTDAGISLFLISLKAGGTGLNLTGADTVIHFDPWWNPAVEEQATSRAHRMGQARNVSAYKLIAAGTVEEKIQALQARKRELFAASLGGDAAFVEKLSGDELEELLTERP